MEETPKVPNLNSKEREKMSPDEIFNKIKIGDNLTYKFGVLPDSEERFGVLESKEDGDRKILWVTNIKEDDGGIHASQFYSKDEVFESVDPKNVIIFSTPNLIK